jgi:hypothetical protein
MNSWVFIALQRNRFEGNLDSVVVDMNAYITELQGTHKVYFLAILLLPIR